MKMKSVILFVVLCGIGIAPGQDRPSQFRGQQRVEQFKKLRMIEALKLDEETSVRFFAKYSKHEQAVRDINKQRDELIDHLQELRKSNTGDDGMEKIFSDLTVLDSKQAEERVRFLGDVKTVLSTQQIADFIVFERNFARNVRMLMQEMAQERRESQR
jgi:hypothetical protein